MPCKSPQNLLKCNVIFTQTTTVLVVRLATEFRCTSIFYGSGSIVLEYVIRYITRHGEKKAAYICTSKFVPF